MPVVRLGEQEFNFPAGTSQEQMTGALDAYRAQQPEAAVEHSIDTDADVRTESVKPPRESYFHEESEVLTDTGELTGEGRPVYKNQFGDSVTERTITEYIPELGGWYNIPTVYDGGFVSPDEAIRRAVEAKGKDPITGREFKSYKTVEDAVRAAEGRSKSIGTKLQNPVPLTDKQAEFAKNIAQIETGGLQNRSVRTQVKPSGSQKGSSAYGTYQITHGLLRGTLENQVIALSGQERAAAEELMARQEVSLSIGGRDRVNYQAGGTKHGIAQKWAKEYGYEDVESFLNDFDYGGTLGLADDADFQVLYESFARKLLNKHLKDAGGDMVAAAAVWHGGPTGAGKTTEQYKQKMRKLMEASNGGS